MEATASAITGFHVLGELTVTCLAVLGLMVIILGLLSLLAFLSGDLKS